MSGCSKLFVYGQKAASVTLGIDRQTLALAVRNGGIHATKTDRAACSFAFDELECWDTLGQPMSRAERDTAIYKAIRKQLNREEP